MFINRWNGWSRRVDQGGRLGFFHRILDCRLPHTILHEVVQKYWNVSLIAHIGQHLKKEVEYFQERNFKVLDESRLSRQKNDGSNVYRKMKKSEIDHGFLLTKSHFKIPASFSYSFHSKKWSIPGKEKMFLTTVEYGVVIPVTRCSRLHCHPWYTAICPSTHLLCFVQPTTFEWVEKETAIHHHRVPYVARVPCERCSLDTEGNC